MIRSDVELTFGDAEPHWHRLDGMHRIKRTHGFASGHAGTSREAFERAVAQAREECVTGPLEKVVISQDHPFGRRCRRSGFTFRRSRARTA
jgi:hypothetical protein